MRCSEGFQSLNKREASSSQEQLPAQSHRERASKSEVKRTLRGSYRRNRAEQVEENRRTEKVEK